MFSEARLGGGIVEVWKAFNGEKDSSEVPRMPLVPSLKKIK